MIGVLTQTRRSTKWQPNVINANMILDNGFALGIITSKHWGEFDKRDEPLITFTISNPGKSEVQYKMPLSEFVSKISEV